MHGVVVIHPLEAAGLAGSKSRVGLGGLTKPGTFSKPRFSPRIEPAVPQSNVIRAFLLALRAFRRDAARSDRDYHINHQTKGLAAPRAVRADRVGAGRGGPAGRRGYASGSVIGCAISLPLRFTPRVPPPQAGQWHAEARRVCLQVVAVRILWVRGEAGWRGPIPCCARWPFLPLEILSGRPRRGGREVERYVCANLVILFTHTRPFAISI